MSLTDRSVLTTSVPRSIVYDAGIDNVGSCAPWLRKRLSNLGSPLHESSTLSTALNRLEEFAGAAASGDYSRVFHPAIEAQRFWINISGTDFLSKALYRGHDAGLRGFEAHYRCLRGGNPVLTEPGATSTGDRNGSWELLLASLVATFAKKVRPVEPPDLVCEFRGETVGIAAKVLYSSDRGTHLKRVNEGARQLEHSNIDCGFVVVNAVELFPHEQMFKNLRSANISNADDALDVMNGWAQAFADTYDLSAWERRLKNKDKTLSILFFVPTVIPFQHPLLTVLPYYRVHVTSIAGREEHARAFEQALHDSCQRVLAHRPERTP